MKKIKITAFGKIAKNDECYSMMDLYKKRVKLYSEIELFELNEPKNTNMELAFLEAENALKGRMDKNDVLVCLDSRGESFSSQEFANLFEEHFRRNLLHFIVGPSFGFSKNFISNAPRVISFSKMTFPHKLFRVMLMEQIYRSFTILEGQKYHK